jgi:hypothetical protein
MCKAYSSIHSEPGSNSSMFNNLLNKLFSKKAQNKQNKKTLINQNTISKINSYITITINVPISYINFRIILYKYKIIQIKHKELLNTKY